LESTVKERIQCGKKLTLREEILSVTAICRQLWSMSRNNFQCRIGKYATLSLWRRTNH